MSKRKGPDVTAHGHGTIAILTPTTKNGKVVMQAKLNVEPWQWTGDGLAVDSRMVGDVIQHLRKSGLRVVVAKKR